MIKVLWKKNKTKCDYCKSTIKYDPEDIQTTTKITFDENYLICPVCKGTTTISRRIRER